MRKRKYEVTISDFYCTECGNRAIPLPRKPNQQREPGHLKNIWCPYCQKETNHAEVRPFGAYTVEDFKKEYALGRFFEGNKKEIKDLLICSNKNCEYNIQGKCWNSNHSYKCKYRGDEI